MRREFWISFVLAAVTLAVYWPLKSHGFLDFDDDYYVTGNAHIQFGFTTKALAWAFSTGWQGNWHPLTWISHILDYRLYGMNPAGHHLTNLFFHAANSVLLFSVLRLMTGAVWRSALVAALFAWHPMHVESVAWVAERKDVLSTFFGLLTLAAYGRYVRESRSPGGKTRVFYALALLLYTLALMSKPMLVTLPFVLLLLDYWPLGRMDEGRGVRPARSGTRQEMGGGKDPVAEGEARDCTTSPRPSPPLRGGEGEQPREVSSLTARALSPREGRSGREMERGVPLSGGQGGGMGWPKMVLVKLPLLEKLPFFALALACSVVTFVLQRNGGAVPSEDVLPLDARAANAAVAYLRYVGKLFWPSHLSVLYPLPDSWPDGLVASGALFVLGVSIVVLASRRSRPYLAVGWLWFIGTLVPVIGLVQAGNQSMADRYSYLPYVGLFVIIAWGLGDVAAQLPKIKPGIILVAAAGLIACCCGTRQELQYWKDSVALFNRAISVTDDNPIALCDLAVALVQRGQFDEGVARARQALEMKPDLPHAEAALAYGLSGQLKSAEAAQHYRRALELDPLDPQTLDNLAAILAMDPDEHNRDGDEAVRLAEQACALTGNLNPLLVGTLAAAYAETSRYDEAVDANTKACRLALAEGNQPLASALQRRLPFYQAHHPFHSEPDPAATEFAAAADLDGHGETSAAITRYRKALSLNPDMVAALNNLAWILATDSDPHTRDGTEAVRLAEHACDLTHYEEPFFIGTLAAAYAEAGQYDQAVAAGNKARKLFLEADMKDYAETNRILLLQYAAHQPHHEPPRPAKAQ
jgi:tetratricopeptide (TPR) repeat protein